MTSVFTPIILWAVGGIVAWLAGRYHLDVNQQQLVSTDVMGGIAFVSAGTAATYAHWKALKSPPPKTGG